MNVIILLPSVFCVLNIEVSDEKNDAGTGTPEKGCTKIGKCFTICRKHLLIIVREIKARLK